MVIYITGGTGQIGMALRKSISETNAEVVVLSRVQPKLYENEVFVQFELGDSIVNSANHKDITLVHLAHDYSDKHLGTSNINYRGLLELSKSEITRYIFVSTPDPLGDNQSVYQKQKRLCVEYLRGETCLILKPSFIYSERHGANKILYYLRRLKVRLPIPRNTNCLSPIKLDSMIGLIMVIGIVNWRDGSFLVKGAEDMCFKDFLEKYHSIKSYYIPDRMIKILLYVLCALKLDITFYIQERIIGIKNLEEIKLLSKSESVIVI